MEDFRCLEELVLVTSDKVEFFDTTFLLLGGCTNDCLLALWGRGCMHERIKGVVLLVEVNMNDNDKCTGLRHKMRSKLKYETRRRTKARCLTGK